MIVKPKVKGPICITAHPLGCKENVKTQIEYIKKLGKTNSPKKVLIIGGSTGYGLATRIATTYGNDASTINIMYEREATERRTATPGWYNTKAFEEYATADGYYAKSINGDAFSKEIKEKTIALIQSDLETVDLVVYSLAAPRRTTSDGTVYKSVLKTTSQPFTEKSWNTMNNIISNETIMPATEEEIHNTVKVMGGEDWMEWMEMLSESNVLSDGAITIAYSYIGPEMTYPIYKNGSIGMAKKDLHSAAEKITQNLTAKNIKAYISVNKALVTQASSAIPIVPLYFAILYKVMKAKNIHEGCIEQLGRLFHEKLLGDKPMVDHQNFIRLDDYELRTDVQEEVEKIWDEISSDNITDLADVDGYMEDFYHMFGFHYDNIDYDQDVEI